jgi:tight adherence protein B
MTPLLTSALIGVLVYLVIVAMVPKHLIFTPTRYTRNQLNRLAEQGTPVQNTMEETLIREQFLSTGPLARAFYLLPFAKSSQPYFVQAGLAAGIDKLFLMGIAIFVLTLFALKSHGLIGLFGAALAGYFVVYYVVKRNIKKRTLQFANQFPDGIDMIVRSVRSGFPLNAAVNMVADSMPSPIGQEFRQVSNEVAYGSTLTDALNRLADRVQTPDVRFFSVVLTLQQDVGGNLAEVLENIAGLIRKRKVLRMKIRALTAEGRATGWVLGLLPVFLATVISIVSPDHLRPLYEEPSGRIILGLAIFLVVLGVGIVRKMVNLEV